MLFVWHFQFFSNIFSTQLDYSFFLFYGLKKINIYIKEKNQLLKEIDGLKEAEIDLQQKQIMKIGC